MTFTSYAQNFEDVMLWRALRHVPTGRYIDVGAQDPVVDSVSKAFYERGWRGIHVEPVPKYADMLRRDRPDETVLQLALSDQVGVLELSVFEDTGLSTAVKEFADAHRQRPGLTDRIVVTPMLPMSTAFASLAGQPVHWLKIDVEGLEESVLRGWDSHALRPWIIVIEATIPMSAEVRYEGAEAILLRAAYEFVYFDGLNRFYVAAEHAELKPAFATPPNVFDGVRLSGLASSELCRGLLDAHRNETRTVEESHQRLESDHRAKIEELNEAHRAEFHELSESIKALRNEVLRAESTNEARRAEVQELSESLMALRSEVLEAEGTTHRKITELANEDHAASLALQMAESQLVAAEQRLAAILGSTSWRITGPMRLVGALPRRFQSALREGRIKSGVKRRIKSVLQTGSNALAQQPAIKRTVLAAVKAMPPLDRRLRKFLAPLPPPSPAPTPGDPLPGKTLTAMSPATRAVYLAMRVANSRE